MSSYVKTLFEDQVYYLRREKQRIDNDLKRHIETEQYAKQQIESLNKQINELYEYYDEVFQAAMSLGFHLEVGLHEPEPGK